MKHGSVWPIYVLRLLCLGLMIPVEQLWGGAVLALPVLYLVIVSIGLQREPAWAVTLWSLAAGGVHWVAQAGYGQLLGQRLGQTQGQSLGADATLSAALLAFVLMAAGLGLQAWLRRQQAKHRLTEQRLAAAERLAATGTLAAVAAHEIRAPLTSVKGFLQMLQRRLHGQEDATWVELIRGDIDRVERLVREFLILGSPRPPRPAQVPLRPLIEESVRAALLPDPGLEAIEVTVACPADLAWVCDREHMRQVLVNLVRNAAEATAPGGQIHIAAAEDHHILTLTVADLGTGIPPELLAQVMEPFFTTKRNGTGLGLAICQELISNNGGHLAVASEHGQGTTVTITLPPAGAAPDTGATGTVRTPITLMDRLARKRLSRQRRTPARAPHAQEGHP